MTRLYRRLTGRTDDFDAVLLRRQAAHHAGQSGERDERAGAALPPPVDAATGAPATSPSTACWRRCEEVIAAFPVYRTYVVASAAPARTTAAISTGRWRRRKSGGAPADTSIFDFIHGVLIGESPGIAAGDVLRTAMQFQQVTGPVMAKASEDTAFYRYFRLLALNEVGGDPRRFGMSLRRLPPCDARAARDLAARDAGDRDARHEARRGCPHPPRDAVGDAARAGASA